MSQRQFVLILALILGLVFGSPSDGAMGHSHSPRGESVTVSRAVVSQSSRGEPWVKLLGGRDIQTRFRDSEAASMIESDSEPLSLFAADFDGDGVPDLVSGYSVAGRGVLVIQSGNIDAIYPNSQWATERRRQGTFTSAPFLPGARVVEIPARPDLLAAGDFNADGRQDLVAATFGGGSLIWVAGSGEGGFQPPEEVAIPGSVTAMLSAEVNRPDGLADLVVGIIGAAGPALLVFEGPDGALRSGPEAIPLPEIPTSIIAGRLAGDSMIDFAASAGHYLTLVVGRDRRLASPPELRAMAPQAQVETVELPFRAASIASGNFAGDDTPEIAVLSDTGVLQVLDFRSYPARDGFSLHGPSLNQALGMAGELRLSLSADARLSPPALLRARVSSRPYDDLLVVDHGTGLRLVMAETVVKHPQPDLAAPIPETAIEIDAGGATVAVLPMRLNADALDDLVMLSRGTSNHITFATTAPVHTFTVDSDITYQDYTPGDGKCETPPYTGSKCTLYAAIQEANASPGADLINFSIKSTTYGTIFGGGGTQISESVTIDGSSQGRVEIYGNGHTVGLSVFGTATTIRGMALNRYSSKAISLGGSGHIVEGNYVGTDVTGSQIVGNPGATGIYVNGQDHLIGGTTSVARNVIAGFTTANIEIDTDFDDKTAGGITIQGNYIGTNANGTDALGTTRTAIDSFRGFGLTIGGASPGAGNLISGNRQNALIALYSTSSTLVAANKLGTNALGTALLGPGVNTGYGIIVGYAIDNGVTYLSTKSTIGGPTPQTKNLISGCPSYAIVLTRASEINVRNNLVGTEITGTSALGNGFGIQVTGIEGKFNDIGGLSPETSNVISGNKNYGIFVFSDNNTISGNYVGTQIDGVKPLRNGGIGIAVYGNSNSIGLSVGKQGEKPNNVIAYNGGDGVYVAATASKNLIRFNSIFDNDGLGIKVEDSTAPQAPVITVANVLGKIQVDGKLTGRSNTTYTIEYYGNDACDPAGSGEGKNFLGWHEVTTDGSGMATFIAPFNPPAGVIVTATASLSSEGSTSQFSVCGGSAGDKVLIENPRLNGANAPNETLLPRPATPTNISFMGDIRFRLTSDNKGGFLTVAAYDVSIPGNPLSLQKPNGEEARIVIPVQMSPAEQLQKDVQLDIRIPSVSAKIQIRVGLFDSNTSSPALLAVDAIDYIRSNARIEFGTLVDSGTGQTFTPITTPHLQANLFLATSIDVPVNSMAFRVTYDLYSPSGTLYLERLGKKKGGGDPIEFSIEKLTVTGGRNQQKYIAIPNQLVTNLSDFWEWRAHLVVTEGGDENFYSDPSVWTIDRVRLVAYSPQTINSFTQGDDVRIGYSLEYNVDRGPGRLTAVLDIFKSTGNEKRKFTIADLPAGAHGVTPPGSPGQFNFTLPLDTTSFRVVYLLSSPPDCDTAGCYTGHFPGLLYKKISVPSLAIPAGVNLTAGALGIDLTDVQNQINRTVKLVRDGKDIVSTVASNPGLSPLLNLAQTSTVGEYNAGVTELKNLLGVNAVWQIDPPIAADGSFTADLAIRYAASDLPDDPNFSEAGLKIVAFYPESGRIEIMPTTLDLANRKASTKVNGLASYYTLAVTGPFTVRRLNYPVINSPLSPALSFINPAAGAVNLSVSDYGTRGTDVTGNPAPVSFGIPSLNRAVKAVTDLFKIRNDGGWIEADSSAGPVLGYESFGDPGRADGLALPAVGWPRLVLPDIELDTGWSTELHIANTTNFSSNLSLELRSSSGATAGTYDTVLGAKGAISGPITDFFPNLPKSFKGYLLINGEQRLAAAGLLVSTNSIAATGGQLWQSGSNTPVKLYGPQVIAGSGGKAELAILNPTLTAASLTLRLINETGGNLAAPVTRSLAPGEQQRLDIAQLFGLNSGNSLIAGLVVESSISGIAGEIGLRDSATGNNYRTMLPLENAPSKMLLFSNVANQTGSFTRLSLFNPGTATANATVRVMRADGSQTGSASIQIAAGGAVTRLLSQLVAQSAGQTGGYVTVTSDQPIAGTGTFGELDNSSLSSLPAQQYDLTVQACTAFTSLGSLSGTPGATVTINGSGLSGVTGVKFGGNAAASFTVASDTRIAATVPYSAVTGPITISRPGCPDVLTSVYTVNTANCVRASISTQLSGNPGGSVTIPVTVTDLTGKGVIAYDAVLNYDPAVLRPQAQSVDNANTISSAMSINANAATPGQIRISAYGSQALAGTGTLLNLKFDVIGNVAACTDLSFSLIRFNEGEPCSAAGSGRFCVTGRSISGTVSYCAADTPVRVPGVTLNLTGAGTGTVTSDSAGRYSFSNLGGGSYTVTPAKSGAATGISSFDAALVAQHVVGLITLSDCRQAAADASGNGTLSSLDAAMIAQYAVGISNPQSQAGTWKFTPASRSYAALAADQANQDFNAILVGEVSGNWTATVTGLALSGTLSDEGFQLQPPARPSGFARGAIVELAVTAGDLTGKGVLSFDLEVRYDPAAFEIAANPYSKAGTLSGGMAVTANPAEPGRLRISAYGAEAIGGPGPLIRVRFVASGRAARAALPAIERLMLNETVVSPRMARIRTLER